MTKIDTNKIAPLQRYYNQNGGGVKPHDAGLLYLRDDVDAAIAALTAERDALRGENEALRAEVERLRHEINEASDPNFIFGAMDNVHDCDTTLDDYADAASRAICAALKGADNG